MTQASENPKYPVGSMPDAELFAQIFDSISEGAFTTDLNMRVTSFNRSAEQITGFARTEAIGQFCFEIFRTDICQSRCPLRTTLEKGISISNVRVNILTREGLKLPINVSTSPLRDRQGTIIGAVEIFRNLSVIEELRKQIDGNYTFENLVSRNREMQEIFNLLPDVAQSECNVLIQGPSGSGKELLAKAIHNLSPRKNRPYVRVNCAALPDTLLESELFGYVKGAFTDARRDKPGRFVLADGGTMLFDEIGDMPPSLQVKMMRVLQEGEVQPLGSTETLHVDVRVIASTNKDIKKLVETGAFREDLYYRLNVISIEIPPLTRRKEDIPILIDHFIKRFNYRTGKNIKGVSDEVLSKLFSYSFPGNVRELENAIEHAFVLCKSDIIEIHHLPRHILESLPDGSHEIQIITAIEEAEKSLIRDALLKHNGNRNLAAQELGMHRTTLWRKIKKLGLDREINSI
jgi:PAS domain S-box-containing protein